MMKNLKNPDFSDWKLQKFEKVVEKKTPAFDFLLSKSKNLSNSFVNF